MATCQCPQALQEGHGENEDMRETDRYGVFAFANHRALILRCAFQNLLLKKLVQFCPQIMTLSAHLTKVGN